MAVYEIEGPDGKVYTVEGPAEGGPAGQRSSPSPAVAAATETAKTLGAGIYGGLTSIPRAIGAAGDWLEKKFPTPEWTKTPVPGGKVIGETDEAIRQALHPETKPGQVASRVLEAGVGALTGPGGLAAPVRSAVVGLSSGAGAEIGRAIDPENPLLALAGGLLGGGLGAIPAAFTPTAKSMIKDAMRGVSAEDFSSAKLAEEILKRNEMPHLKSQLLGEASSLDDIVQQASSHPKVRPTILKATQGIAPQARETAEVWKARNLPIAVEERRGLLLDVQKSAKEAEQAAIGQANAEFRAALPPHGVYPKQYMNTLREELRSLAEGSKYGPTSSGGEAILNFIAKKLPPEGKSMTRDHLNNLIKDLNTLTTTEGWKGLPVSDLKRVLKEYTPEYEAARAAKTAAMRETVSPIQQGLAGDIARMGGGPNPSKYTVTGDVLKTVFPMDKAQPQAILKLGKDVGGESVGHLLREHLTRSMEMAGKGIGESRQAPIKFVEAVAATPAQRANLQAALEVVAKDSGANPAAVKKGFDELLHAFGTYKDLKVSPGVAGSNVQFEAGKSFLGAAVAPASRAGRWLWERATAKTYQKIADIVTSPKGLEELERIARTPDFKVKRALLRGVIASAMANDEESSPTSGNPPDITTD